MAFIEWIQNNWMAVAQALAGLMVFAGMVTGFFAGPRADKAKGIFDYILGLLRTIGIGTYRDEPGTLSVPFKGDTKERVATVEKV